MTPRELVVDYGAEIKKAAPQGVMFVLLALEVNADGIGGDTHYSSNANREAVLKLLNATATRLEGV